jgi:hypothetical protein
MPSPEMKTSSLVFLRNLYQWEAMLISFFMFLKNIYL